MQSKLTPSTAKPAFRKSQQEPTRIKFIKYLDDLGLNTPVGFAILTIVIFTGSVGISAIYLSHINHLDLLGLLIKDQPLIYLIGLLNTIALTVMSVFVGLAPQSLIDSKEIREWPFYKNRIAYAFAIALTLPAYLFLRYANPYSLAYFESAETIIIDISIMSATLIYLLYPSDEWQKITKTRGNRKENKSQLNIYKKYCLQTGEALIKLAGTAFLGFYSAGILYVFYIIFDADKLTKHYIQHLSSTLAWYCTYIGFNGILIIKKAKNDFSLSLTKIIISSLLATSPLIILSTDGAIFRYAFIVSGMADGVGKSSWYFADIESIKKDGAHKISGNSIILGQQSFPTRQIDGQTQIKAYRDIKHEKTIVLCPDWLNGKSREFLTCPEFNVDHIRKYQE